ncbi:MAG TPA: xanthine dehydrogenase family protein molybdopterin-binding subunit [Actinomycetota bacterium]|nr:xanthine dehydrogenase family protein molybdopterin-binding subunit [Actinomycetota bacterium]
MTTVPPSAFGVPALRSEDPRFLRGEGRYLENVEIPGALRAVFVRSMMPHAELKGIDGLDAARAMPDVVAVYAADDLSLAAMPPAGNVETPDAGDLSETWGRPPLARDRVRFAGEAVALVVAGSLGAALDAAELVWPDVEPLDAVTDPERALGEDAPVLFPAVGTNVAHAFEHAWADDPLAGSDVVVRGRFVNQRVAPVPMETNGIAVVPSADEVTVWVSTQVPFDVRDDLADVLGMDKRLVRVIAPDVGGGFGAKLQIYPEYWAVAKAAQLLGRPVRWTETRTESMLSLTHGRGQIQYVEIGARRDGTITGLRADLIADMGAYPIGAYLPTTTGEMATGAYAIERLSYRGRSVVTNATPIAPYRGAGRPEATALVERAIDMVAGELGIDPAEIRRRNLIADDAFPYATPTGMTYDNGAYTTALDRAVRIADVPALRAEQRVRRERGDHLALGIGLSSYVEITSFSSKEFGEVRVGDDGRVTVLAGTSSHGQGHETAFAQLAASIMGVSIDDVTVVHSDTRLVERGAGTWGSRSLQAGGSSVAERALEVVDTARTLAAHELEVDEADLVGPADGGFGVAGAPERRISWAELATIAADDTRRPDGMPSVGLGAKGVYREPGSTFPFGTHVAVVEVDTETGAVELLRLVAVDDCGRILNPALVRGQQHGGIGQGVAQALFEEVLFDEVGNPVTANLTGYLMPSAADLPSFEASNTETPTPVNPLGAKGIGESGSIGSTPAVQNAVVDALAHLGVVHVDLPCSPERVRAAIAAAS